MVPEAAMAQLKAAVTAFLARDQEGLTTGARGEELIEVRSLIDSLEADFSSSARAFQAQSGHLADGAPTAISWLSRCCKMSSTSAADRLCVGRQLQEMPEAARALACAEIGYQSTSILCHFRERLGEQLAQFDESMMVGYARQFRVAQFRELCRRAWHAIDPDGFDAEQNLDFERRWLHLSPLMNGMQSIDGVLDAAGGAAVRTALEALAGQHGPEDERTRKQRMADALVELSHHALDAGTLPSRGGVRPHISLTTTVEGLKGELGAPASDLEHSLPVSSKTLQRFACDSTVSRVLLADSEVIDVGRATRVISGPTRRGLHARDRRCRFPGCDRPIGWTQPHHIELWSRGGPSRPPNLISLCHFHHRLVHEGGWQVVKTGKELRFLRLGGASCPGRIPAAA
jgi:Domain of unknown function (DUF222)